MSSFVKVGLRKGQVVLEKIENQGIIIKRCKIK